jgi:hypothetical protein
MPILLAAKSVATKNKEMVMKLRVIIGVSPLTSRQV